MAGAFFAGFWFLLPIFKCCYTSSNILEWKDGQVVESTLGSIHRILQGTVLIWGVKLTLARDSCILAIVYTSGKRADIWHREE